MLLHALTRSLHLAVANLPLGRPLFLVIMSSFLSSFSKAFKSGGEPTSENQNPQLTVKWGKEK